MNDISVASVIVTYNRKYELLECLKSVIDQSYRVHTIVIVDNASSDNTFEYIYNSFLPKAVVKQQEQETLIKILEQNCIPIYYYRKEKNTGGSGGFYTGLKISKELFDPDFVWLMDDDGYPSQNCLESLLQHGNHYDYLMPVSIDIADHEKLSWPTRLKNKRKTLYYKKLKESWGSIMNFVTPFNGALLSNKCISTVGYINKDFFIWGDEYEHYWRCRKNNINPVTDMNALFYHPAQKLPLVPICNGLFRVPYVDSKLRMICLVRNYTYIYLHYDKKIKIAIKFLMYSWLFLITRKGDFSNWKLYIQSVCDAFRNDFTRHLKYIQIQ